MDNRANFALTGVTTNYNAIATSIDVTDASVFPAAPFNATWWNSADYPNPSQDPSVEIVRVTDITGNTLTIVRAQESTTASDKNTGATYMLSAGLTVKTLDDIESDIAAAQATADAQAAAVALNTAKRTYPQTAEDKLATVQSGATDDQSGAEIKAAYEGESNTNAFTDSEKTKLAGLEDSLFLGVFTDLAALQTAHASPAAGSYAYLDAGSSTDIEQAIWDDTDGAYVVSTGTGSETSASIKTKYEANADTNAFTDSEKTKVGNTPADTNAAIQERQKVTYSSTAPSSPVVGDKWVKTDEDLELPVRSGDIASILTMTQAEYDAITPATDVLYLIVE